MNKIGVFSLIGLFAVLSVPTHARPQFQNDMSQADGFIFDGPADRPNKFPPNGISTTSRPWQPTQPIDVPPTPNTGNNNNNNQLTTSTTQSPQVARCIRDCPVTSEYNPICGTDQVTYSNPGRLTCAQACGAPVSVMRMGPCNTQMRG